MCPSMGPGAGEEERGLKVNVSIAGMLGVDSSELHASSPPIYRG